MASGPAAEMVETEAPTLNFEKLNEFVKEKNDIAIINELELILNNSNAQTNIESDGVVIIKKLLADSKNQKIQILSIKLIAELAKNETNRKKLSENEVIFSILKKLNESEMEVEIQACRALGNLCYECDQVRSLLYENGALSSIIELLRRNIEIYESGKCNLDNCSTLRKVACGLLFNFLVTNDDIQKSAVQHFNIAELVEIMLKIECEANNEDCLTHLLLILTLVLDSNDDGIITEAISKLLVDILRNSTNPDISELCLEILQGQAENDLIKYYLAKYGLCQLMYKLLEKHKQLVNDEETRALMKMVCDLIVQVLTGDEAMTYLYDNGKGETYKYMIEWLDSSDVDLQTTGVLAIGNFARKDTNCIYMVENESIVEKLISILSKHNSINGDLKVQHATLSALRNLAIPKPNKHLILTHNFIDCIYPMLSNPDQMPAAAVVFKLLGTIRMIIDGQEETALRLCSDSNLIVRIVDWCFSTDHLGVKAESSRLLAWLIKNCKHEGEKQSKAYETILLTSNSLKCLVDMIPSQHAVMQNEALLALNLLVYNYLKTRSAIQSTIHLDIELINANLGSNLQTLLKLPHLEKEVIENLITLMRQLIEIYPIAMKQHFDESKLSQQLKEIIVNNTKLNHLCQQVDQLNINH